MCDSPLAGGRKQGHPQALSAAVRFAHVRRSGERGRGLHCTTFIHTSDESESVEARPSALSAGRIPAIRGRSSGSPSEEPAGLREGPDADASPSPPSGERAGTVRRPEATAPSRRDQDLKPRGSWEQCDSMRRPARPVRGEGEGHCRRTTRTEALLQPRRTAVARMLSAASWAVRAPIARQPECQDKGSKVQMSQSKMFGGRAVQKPIAHLGAC